MTQPSPETREREQYKLFLNDAETIRYLGIPEPGARDFLREMEDKYGFPRKLKNWGNRRYRRAIDAYLDAEIGVKSDD